MPNEPLYQFYETLPLPPPCAPLASLVRMTAIPWASQGGQTLKTSRHLQPRPSPAPSQDFPQVSQMCFYYKMTFLLKYNWWLVR